MEVRSTEEAADDLERIADYFFEFTPGHAERIVRTLYNAPGRLLTTPIWVGRERSRARASL
jgi:plasmid stabilization system protein ParE